MLAKAGIRLLAKIIAGLLIFVVIYIGFALLTPMFAVNATDADPREDVTIYIKTNGVHTDIVMPISNEIYDWRKLANPAKTIYGDESMRFIAVGWGDKGFYLNTPEWSDLKFSTAFNAAFYLGTSAMHTTFYRELYEDTNCIKVMISNVEYKRLVTFIESSFERDSDGNSIYIVGSYGNNDSFYEAKGSYNLFYTCNTWANNALKEAGQKTAIWSLTDTGILRHYR